MPRADQTQQSRSEGTRLLTFEAPGLTVELQVTALGTRRHMIGQLVPNRQARVMVRHQDGIATVDADGFGRSGSRTSRPGPVRCDVTWAASKPAPR